MKIANRKKGSKSSKGKEVKPGKVELELLKATKMKIKKGESRQKFLERLATAVYKDLDKKQYNKLSDPAAKWYEQAADAANSGGLLPDPSLPSRSKKVEAKPFRLKKKPEIPSWKDLQKMDEDELMDLAEAYDIDMEKRQFPDFTAVHKYLAMKLKIDRPVTFSKPKPKNMSGKLRFIESSLPDWKKLSRMGVDPILDLIEEEGHGKKLKKDYADLTELRNHAAKILGITVPKQSRTAPPKRHTGTLAKKKPAAKAKQPTKREIEAEKKRVAKLKKLESAVRKLGYKGQVVEAILDATGLT